MARQFSSALASHAIAGCTYAVTLVEEAKLDRLVALYAASIAYVSNKNRIPQECRQCR